MVFKGAKRWCFYVEKETRTRMRSTYMKLYCLWITDLSRVSIVHFVSCFPSSLAIQIEMPEIVGAFCRHKSCPPSELCPFLQL